MEIQTYIFYTLIIWGFTYIAYSLINSRCMAEKELYFFMSPNYIKNKLGFGKFMTVCLSVCMFIITPVYYISLVFMIGLRGFVDTVIWSKKSKELEEKLKTMEEFEKSNKKKKNNTSKKKQKNQKKQNQHKKDNKPTSKNIKRLN